MNKAVRKAVIAGNWKMNKTPAEAKELLNAIAPLVKDAGCDVVACVPYVDLQTALEATAGTNIKIGAEKGKVLYGVSYFGVGAGHDGAV